MVIKFTGCQIFGNPFFIADVYDYFDFAEAVCMLHLFSMVLSIRVSESAKSFFNLYQSAFKFVQSAQSKKSFNQRFNYAGYRTIL